MNLLLRPAAVAFLLIGLTQPVFAQQDKPPKLVAPKYDADRVYDAVTEPATPVGGAEAYDQYLADHLTYPTSALQRNVQGTDSVEFIVEKNGSLSNLRILQPFDPECDAEALRVIKAGPKWTPAKHRNNVVRQRVVVPVMFAIGVLPTAAPTSSTTSSPTSAGPALTGLQVVQPDSAAGPPGGTDAFFAWVQQQLQYPAEARKFKREGKVRVEFIIEPDGSLSNAKVLDKLGFGMDAEALRLIKVAPPWRPARYQGKLIRQKMVLPIIFQL